MDIVKEQDDNPVLSTSPQEQTGPRHLSLVLSFLAVHTGAYAPSFTVSNAHLCLEHMGAPQDSPRQLGVHVAVLCKHHPRVCVRAGNQAPESRAVFLL